MRKFFEKWRNELPGVAASLTTAFLLFLASIIAYRFKDALWPSDALGYPLICIGEAVASEQPDAMTVEFYVINTTDETYSERQLEEQLKAASAGTTAVLSPTIELESIRDFARIEPAMADAEFNKDKGELIVMSKPGSNRVQIRVAKIDARAILRAYITVSGLPMLNPPSRAAKSDLPFNIRDYEDACYHRT